MESFKIQDQCPLLGHGINGKGGGLQILRQGVNVNVNLGQGQYSNGNWGLRAYCEHFTKNVKRLSVYLLLFLFNTFMYLHCIIQSSFITML